MTSTWRLQLQLAAKVKKTWSCKRKSVEAFNVVCPHAGCFVDYRTDIKKFFCPCHNSAFALTGAIDDPKSPSPRGLDSLNVEIGETGDVWVEFQNFHTGTAKKVPMA